MKKIIKKFQTTEEDEEFWRNLITREKENLLAQTNTSLKKKNIF